MNPREEQAAFDSGEPHAIPVDYVRQEIAYFARLVTVELKKAETGPLELSPTAMLWRALDNAQRRFMFEEVNHNVDEIK